MAEKKRIKILFQGDSITDCNRNRKDPHDLGDGYPKFAALQICEFFPEYEFEFMNLGISGNRTPDLLARLQPDFIDIKADIVSILIGINDTWHFANSPEKFPDSEYESAYRTVLSEIKEKTNAKIIMIEQFLLYTPDKASFRPDMGRKMEINRALAREFADIYIPLDGLFAAASVQNLPTYYAEDGVHPTINGAKFIADYYVEAFELIINNIMEDNQ